MNITYANFKKKINVADFSNRNKHGPPLVVYDDVGMCKIKAAVSGNRSYSRKSTSCSYWNMTRNEDCHLKRNTQWKFT